MLDFPLLTGKIVCKDITITGCFALPRPSSPCNPIGIHRHHSACGVSWVNRKPGSAILKFFHIFPKLTPFCLWRFLGKSKTWISHLKTWPSSSVKDLTDLGGECKVRALRKYGPCASLFLSPFLFLGNCLTKDLTSESRHLFSSICYGQLLQVVQLEKLIQPQQTLLDA